MRGSLTRCAWIAGVAFAATLPLCGLQAAEVKAARVWAGPEYTRVVFDLSGPASYKLSQQDGQVVLDLSDSHVAGSFNAPSAQGLYKGLSNALAGSNLRLTATMAPNSQPKSFVLGPSGQSGYRLVLDLYPGTAVSTTAASPAAPVQTPAPVVASTKDSAPSTPVSPPPAPTSVAAKSSTQLTSNKSLNSRQVAVMLGGERKVIVAIDAGHGGKDQGAHGPGGTLEKDVTLAVARDLAAQINKQPGMQAILTRDGDYFIPLTRRYEIARENKADLFVAIHADSFSSSDARGSSVWVLSSRGKSSVAARVLADRENSSDLIGGVSLDDKSDSLASVLLDMQQGWAVQASDAIAGNVLSALSGLGPTHRGYVEHANFVVLRSPDVPSILVETAFISNPDEERKLRDPAHQHQLAAAVMGGVKSYFESTPPPGTWFAAQAARRIGVMVASDDTPAAQKTSTKLASNASSDAQDTHKVAAGESLRSIARRYGVSVSSLKSANNISSNSVHAGMVLTIPTS
ncbi:MAG: N-acetylmuramoyl-L-alanine amidase [Rhodanobacter sp.]